jgi:membrane protease subunit HflC
MNRIGLVVGGLLLLLMLASSTLFVVDQRQVAIVYEFGKIKEVIQEPGLQFKLPPPFQNVVFLDRRIQTLDSPETRPIFTAEKKSLVIDWLVKWRVTDRASSSATTAPTCATSRRGCRRSSTPRSTRRSRKRTVGGVLSTERDKVMQDVRSRLGDDAALVRHRDPRRPHQARRLRRQHHGVDLQPHGVGAQAVANQLRSSGSAEGEKIRADADSSAR